MRRLFWVQQKMFIAFIFQRCVLKSLDLLDYNVSSTVWTHKPLNKNKNQTWKLKQQVPQEDWAQNTAIPNRSLESVSWCEVLNREIARRIL